MKERRFVLGALLACLVIGAASYAGLAAAKPGKSRPSRSRWPGSIRARTTTAAGRPRTTPAASTPQRMLGGKIQTTYKDKAFSNAQVPQIVAGLVRDGYKMIFATSFGELELRRQRPALREVPEGALRAGDGTQLKKNQSEYFGAGEDTIYLSGMAAGAASKKGVIGYVVPFGIPEVVRHINAFTLGAQATHPGAKVKIVWTNAWYSPPKETAAAKALVASGADVLGQNVDSPAAGVYAESKGIPWVGYDADAQKFAPKQWLTAAVYNWGPYYAKRIQAAIDGTWKPGFYYGSINDGFTSLAPFGPKVSAKTKAAIAAKMAAIKSGKFDVFSGPIYDQSGKLKVPAGTTLKVRPDLYSMQWLAKGVVGSVSHVPPPG